MIITIPVTSGKSISQERRKSLFEKDCDYAPGRFEHRTHDLNWLVRFRDRSGYLDDPAQQLDCERVASPWGIEPFDRLRHDRSGFDCGLPALNDWLATKVSQFEKKDLARTYVLVETGMTIVKGYYALSNHTVVYESLPEGHAKELPQIDMPVVLIGRPGVDSSVQGQGLEEFLLIDALRRAEYLAKKIGIRAVEVDAINDDARHFYERYGFYH